MEPEERASIVREIEVLAAKLGADTPLENTSDSEEHEFHIHVGLAEAAADILRDKPFMLSYWLGFCVTNLGYNPNTDRFGIIREDLDEFFATEERDGWDSEE